MAIIESDHEETKSELLLFEDFRSGVLDRSIWNVRTSGRTHNNEQQAYVDSPETIYVVGEDQLPGTAHGALVIHPRYHPGFATPEGDRFDFVSGRIDSREKFDFKYGTAAARMMLPPGQGFWPAFWMMGYGPWPDTGEIDIMEYVGERDWVSSAVHGPDYHGEMGLVNKLYFPTAADAAGWHIYAVDWKRDELTFTVDGQTIFRITRPMAEFFGPWVFDNDKYLILNFALGGTYPFKCNGVQAPYYGMPEETVQKIKDDQAWIAVDWVKVSRDESGDDVERAVY